MVGEVRQTRRRGVKKRHGHSTSGGRRRPEGNLLSGNPGRQESSEGSVATDSRSLSTVAFVTAEIFNVRRQQSYFPHAQTWAGIKCALLASAETLLWVWLCMPKGLSFAILGEPLDSHTSTKPSSHSRCGQANRLCAFPLFLPASAVNDP